jgi:hypothetical protein
VTSSVTAVAGWLSSAYVPPVVSSKSAPVVPSAIDRLTKAPSAPVVALPTAAPRTPFVKRYAVTVAPASRALNARPEIVPPATRLSSIDRGASVWLPSVSRAMARSTSGPSGRPASGSDATTRSGDGSVSVIVTGVPSWAMTSSDATPSASEAVTSMATAPLVKTWAAAGEAQSTAGPTSSKGSVPSEPNNCGSRLSFIAVTHARTSVLSRPVPLAGVRSHDKIAAPRRERIEFE